MDEIVDDEPALLQRLECRAVAVASDDKPGQPVEPVLPAGHGSVVGPEVLDEQEASSGLKHPPDLTHRPRLIVHAAQHEGRHDGVEARILERQVLCRGAQHRRRPACPIGNALETPQHRPVGLGHG